MSVRGFLAKTAAVAALGTGVYLAGSGVFSAAKGVLLTPRAPDDHDPRFYTKAAEEEMNEVDRDARAKGISDHGTMAQTSKESNEYVARKLGTVVDRVSFWIDEAGKPVVVVQHRPLVVVQKKLAETPPVKAQPAVPKRSATHKAKPKAGVPTIPQ